MEICQYTVAESSDILENTISFEGQCTSNSQNTARGTTEERQTQTSTIKNAVTVNICSLGNIDKGFSFIALD